jgi:hypothetical protein
MMQGYPAVVIRSLEEARACLGVGIPVTLLSEQGAGLYAGGGWWRGLVGAARASYPGTPMQDILDCADGSGQAMAALRIGQLFLVLNRMAPGWDAVRAAARGLGGEVLADRPAAFQLRVMGRLWSENSLARARLVTWLQSCQ